MKIVNYHMTTRRNNKLSPKPSGLNPIKHLGQHFLISSSVVKKIIAAANIRPGETVLEIGPGTGVLTQALVVAGAVVIAVEKDRGLAEMLKTKMFEIFKIENLLKIENCKLKIIVKDILRFNEIQIGKPYKIVANIPYYITGPIIQKFLFSKNPPTEMVLMVQKEVGQRITAQPPRANYLSSLVQSLAEAKMLFKVKKENFWPRPKVDSAVIRIVTSDKRQGTSGEKQEYVEFLKVIFKQPRQTLWNNLRRAKTIPADNLENVLKELGLEKNMRGQNLNQWQLAAIFQNLAPSDNVKFQSSNIKPNPKL